MKVRPDGSQEYSAEEQLAKVKLGQIELDAPLRKERNRRLARYDEAIRLIQEYRSEWENPSSDLLYRRKCRDRLFAFLASEPKEGR